MEPLITVIIPVYNVGDYLRTCLNSVVNQTYRNLDVILINDGSTDGSGAVCDEYASRDPRIRVFHQANGGVSQARNTGLEVCKGEFVTFVDGDDWLESTHIKLLKNTISQDDVQLGVVNLFYDYPDKPTERDSAELEGIRVLSQAETFWGLLHSTKIGGFLCNKIFCKNLITQLLDTDLQQCEDFVFCANYTTHVTHAACVDTPTYHYRLGRRVPERSLSYDARTLSLLKSYLRIEEIYQKHSPENITQVHLNILKDALNIKARYIINHINHPEEWKFINHVAESYNYLMYSDKVPWTTRANLWLTMLFPKTILRLKMFYLDKQGL